MAGGRVRNSVRHAFISVAGGVECREQQLADTELLAVINDASVLPVESRTVKDLCVGEITKPRRPADEVLVAVGFKDVADLQTFAAGDVHIYLAVTARINDRGIATVTDNIGIMRNSGGLYPFENHPLFLLK